MGEYWEEAEEEEEGEGHVDDINVSVQHDKLKCSM